jgi:hypothetical protein
VAADEDRAAVTGVHLFSTVDCPHRPENTLELRYMTSDDKKTDANEARYAFHSYSHLMTEREHLAFRHLSGTMKATLGRSDVNAQREVKRTSSHLRNLLSQDPDVLALARDGYEAFVLRTGQRILEEKRDLIFLNYCPQCSALARTPKARQCRFCGHDWH